MNILYLNNFRGFQNSFIPIRQVNFLVGENSTGKSSILSILRLLSSANFWNNDDFNTSDVELGFFDELVTKNATSNSKEFQIGYYREKTKGHLFNILLATYKNVKGEPILTELKFHIDKKNIKVKINNKQCKVYIKTVDYNINEIEDYELWINDFDFSSVKYKILERDDDYTSRNLFFDLKYFLKKELSDSKDLLGLARPVFLPISTWIAPIRSKPKRTYESFKLVFSPEGDHTPLLIKSIMSNEFKKNITKEKFLKIIVEFGKRSGLFDNLEIQSLGKDRNSPFHLNIFLNNIPLKITNVGYGVGQVLPLLTEILVTIRERWFTIQQPEVHLHPRAQAALGNFIYDAAINEDKGFLIETHSDFLIDRFRYCIKKKDKFLDSQVLFFERTKNGNIVHSIEINNHGQYPEEQPENFRKFFINEELTLLSI